MRRIIGVALCILGLALAIFGVVWMAAIWPNLAKVPAGLKQQVDLDGTVSLYDPGQGDTQSFTILGHRRYTALSATEKIVYLQEDIWFDIAGTDQELQAVRQQFLLGIDRVTRENVEGRGDGVGGGHYNFPFNVSKDKVYRFWNEGNPENIDCEFVEEKDFQGLHLYVFEMSTPDGGLLLPAEFDSPAMRIDQRITLYVEPVTGMPVYMESTTRRSGLVPVPDENFPTTTPFTYKEVTFYADELKFNQDTIDDLVGQAKSARTQVALGKNLLPWLSIGVGIVFIAAGAFLVLRVSRPVSKPEPQAAGESKPN